MNPFCEIAVEEAIRLKERNVATEVVAVSVGPKAAQETLRTAMAMGADKGIHIVTDARTDQELLPLAVAKLFKFVSDKVCVRARTPPSPRLPRCRAPPLVCEYAAGRADGYVRVDAQEKPDMWILGKQSIDGDNNQTGQRARVVPPTHLNEHCCCCLRMRLQGKCSPGC